MVASRYFHDFSEGETLDLGTVTITEAEIIAFGRQYDPQPFHVDPEAARASPFGGVIASGWQTGGLYMRAFVDGVLNHTPSMGSPGIDELRWQKPVRPGDTLRMKFVVLEVRPSRSKPDRGIVRSRGEVYNQHGELVMSIEAANIIGRRPAAT